MNKVYKILLFAGTAEGREIAEFLNEHEINTYVCVATKYGGKVIPDGDYLTVSAKRLDTCEISHLIQAQRFQMVIDATHPYADVVSDNIKMACEEQQAEYIRLVRKSVAGEKEACIYVSSVEEAVDYLGTTTGNVLITTGSKELHKYIKLQDYRSRLYARVLSTASITTLCGELGFEGKNLICMQGPFSTELNAAMLKEINASYLVTKESGKAGGSPEKLEAANQTNVTPIIIGRPCIEQGPDLEELKSRLIDTFHIPTRQEIYLVGAGMGNVKNMTIEAYEACEHADVIIGAKRVVDSLAGFHKKTFYSYDYNEIRGYIEEHLHLKCIVIALSGDVGFYSGARKLMEVLNGKNVHMLCGISSVVYLSSKIQVPWDQMYLLSLHGRNQNLAAAVRENAYVFALTGGNTRIKDICNILLDYGLEDVVMWVGEHLSYQDERIVKGTPFKLRDLEFDSLSVVVIENILSKKIPVTHGIPDDHFIRGKVPMTKSEVRSISLSKLGLYKDSIIYDIGAGTGSVSIEMAIQAREGIVYAIEKKEEAVLLISKNKNRFSVTNLEIIQGSAPEALHDLPAPTHVFIGGSSGNMEQVIRLVLHKNKATRIVVNAIALETLGEVMNCIHNLPVTEVDIVCVQSSKAKEMGNYHMMMGQNPVYIISFTGGEI